MGTTSGFAINPEDGVDPTFIEMLAEDPKNDAIIRIGLVPAQVSANNNFSEVLVVAAPPTTPPPTYNPPPIPPTVGPSVYMPPLVGILPQFAGYVSLIEPMVGGGSGGPVEESELSWHLSVIDAGMPRDMASAAKVDPTLWTVATYLETTNWDAERLSGGRWLLPHSKQPSAGTMRGARFCSERSTRSPWRAISTATA